MLENFVGLKVKGRCFENETTLNFFPKDNKASKDARVSLVYGRNGSGKSTLSKIFLSLKIGTPLDGMDPIEVLPVEQAATGLAAIGQKTYVFNEDYIRRKMIFEGDSSGLGSIVLFGEQKDLDELIKRKTTYADAAKQELDKLEAREIKTNTPGDPSCPKTHFDKILSTLQNKKTRSGWAYRNAEIFNHKKAPTPDNDLVGKIMFAGEAPSEQDTFDLYNSRLAQLRNIDSIPVDFTVPKICIESYFDFDEVKLLQLLNRKIEKPSLSDRDKKIAEVISGFGLDWTTNVTEHLKKEKTTYCPCCLKPITPGEKDDVLKALQLALSQEVKNYQNELASYEFPSLPAVDFTAYEIIAPKETASAKHALSSVTKSYDYYRELIRKRQDDIFGDVKYHPTDTRHLVLSARQSMNILEQCRQEFERAKNDINKSRAELEALNRRLARKEIESDYAAYVTSKKEQVSLKSSIIAMRSLHEKHLSDIAKLEARKSNVKIAADRINSALAYIFLSKERIRLIPSNGIYTVEVNGHPVKPVDISIGERNALALAYFFSEMMEGSDARKSYEKEKLIILDDPVSSFDHENKMGVLSYLMYEIENLTCTIYDDNGQKKRSESQVICLMHELYSFLALATSINSHDKSSPVKIGQWLSALDCRKNELLPIPQRIDNINEYRRNFDEIYEYACKATPDDNLHVGNQARRLLEAFSTFIYREGLEHLFFAEVVKGPDAAIYNTYFKAVFSRFVVNDESHLQGRIRSLTNGNSLFPFIDNTRKQSAVRDSICLLYLIMPEHILSLCEDKDPKQEEAKRAAMKQNIESWLQDIRNFTPSNGVDAV